MSISNKLLCNTYFKLVVFPPLTFTLVSVYSPLSWLTYRVVIWSIFYKQILIRAALLPSICCKSILTPTNSDWSSPLMTQPQPILSWKTFQLSVHKINSCLLGCIIANTSWLSSFSFGPGFFGIWNFGRSNKHTGPPSKKVTDVPNLRTLELTGDLIGHSGAVQVQCHE